MNTYVKIKATFDSKTLTQNCPRVSYVPMMRLTLPVCCFALCRPRYAVPSTGWAQEQVGDALWIWEVAVADDPGTVAVEMAMMTTITIVWLVRVIVSSTSSTATRSG